MYNISDRSVRFVRDRIQDLMATRVSIYPHASQTFNESTGMMDTNTREPVYTGKARIWEVNTGDTMILGDTTVSLTRTHISIPFDGYIPEKDDLVRVLYCKQDPNIEGKTYRVVSIDGSGQIGAVRRMTVVAYADSSVWEER